MTQYRILDGVHRCVAARLAGMKEIQAVVDRHGVLSEEQTLDLDQLFSPKSWIGRWDRGRDLHDLVKMIADPAKRARLRPIIVVEIIPTMMKSLTPVSQVAVT